MMIEKSGSIRLKDISVAGNLPPEQQALAAGMVRVTHLYRSALKVAVTQMEILDEEFARMYDHSPIHHIEYRIKSLDSIVDKLKRRGFEVSIDNIYAHIQDLAGIRVICNYLDDIYYLRSLLFVGIPLPGTGAWTGTLAASLLDMDFKKSVLACMGGVLLAGVIMGALSQLGVEVFRAAA